MRKNKKGMTLVEALLASAVLIIMVAAIIAIIAFANSIIGKNVSKERELTRAESIADALMSAISNGVTDADVLKQLTGAEYVPDNDEFSSEPGIGQFKFIYTVDSEGIEGYKIYVRINGDDGSQIAYVTAYASVGGGSGI
jgi:Tfp pilus assembly protein FimT